MPYPAAYDNVAITLAASPTVQSIWVPIGNPTELGLYIPTLSPATTVTVKVAQDASGTGAQTVVDGTGTQTLVYGSGTGAFAIGSNHMGACLGYSHIGVLVGTAQTTGKTFLLTRKTVGTDPAA